MDSFGTKLKREREKRKVTLEDVSISTKISTRFLNALESDRLQDLPGGIFNKGFVRAYARHLGLDEEAILSEFALASGEEAPQQPATDQPAPKPKPVREKVWQEEPAQPTELPWGYLIIALVLVGFGLAFWGVYSHEKEPPAESASAPVHSATPTTTSPSSSAPASVPAAAPVQQPAPASSTPAPAPSSPTAADTFTVTLSLRQDCWISATADDDQLIRGTLPAQSQRTLHARKKLVITVGNAAAVDLTFNGKSVPPVGAENEVKTVTFTSNGVLQSATTPAPSNP